MIKTEKYYFMLFFKFKAMPIGYNIYFKNIGFIMNKKWIVAALLGLMTVACGEHKSDQDKQIAENEKKIALLKQQAEIQNLENQIHHAGSKTIATASEVYQLSSAAVSDTLSKEAQIQGKSGDIVKGNDGQQYMYDSSTGNWLLYGAIGAAAGYMAANAMNRNKYDKYVPVQRPTAAVERVYQDYKINNPKQLPAPKVMPKAQNNSIIALEPNRATSKPTPNYRQSDSAKTMRFNSFGFRRKR